MMGSDLPGEEIEGGRGGRWGESEEKGRGRKGAFFYWVFGAEAKEESREGLWSSGGGLGHSAGLARPRVYRAAVRGTAAAQLIRGFARVHTIGYSLVYYCLRLLDLSGPGL